MYKQVKADIVFTIFAIKKKKVLQLILKDPTNTYAPACKQKSRDVVAVVNGYISHVGGNISQTWKLNTKLRQKPSSLVNMKFPTPRLYWLTPV